MILKRSSSRILHFQVEFVLICDTSSFLVFHVLNAPVRGDWWRQCFSVDSLAGSDDKRIGTLRRLAKRFIDESMHVLTLLLKHLVRLVFAQ